MLDFLERIARQAGDMAMDYRGRLTGLRVERKTEKDLVTEADRAVEDFIVGAIRRTYPDHAICGEETGSHAGGDYRWVIDPIDGTASFVHGQPYFGVSIAVEYRGVTTFGAVCAPALGELFLAERGGGATCNGMPLRVSSRDALVDSMLATGFACIRGGAPHHNLPYFNALMPLIRDIRRYGSAAVDLCYVAAGRIEGFWEIGLHDYDIAAGLLMVTEAGGRYTDLDGATSQLPQRLLASNGRIHDAVLECFRPCRAGDTGQG